MAIHLPRQRNSFGVPARYMDLKSAGLLYVPPGEWRYDSYDIEGDVATLYAQDVDLADYQYNADHGIAQVLPEGASAIDCTGRWKIVSGELLYKMPVTNAWVNTGLGGGFTGIGGFYDIDGGHNTYAGIAVLACKGGQLCYVLADQAYNFIQYNFTGANATNWLTVNGLVAPDDSTNTQTHIYGTSLTGHAMTTFWDITGPGSYSSGILTPYTNVQVAGTSVSLPADTYLPLSVYAVSGLILERDSGTLFTLVGNALSFGTGWTSISGHARTIIITSDAPYQYTRMYGIKDGNLYSLRKSSWTSDTGWTATLIDDSGDWYMVQFISPDVAVAIRRVNTAGGGGTIDPLGDVIVSGTSTALDGTYTLVSGTGESRLWRRDDGYNRYEIYFDSGYWVIHSSYDEMGTGEYTMHFDECRGAGTDPWTATWETSWDDGVSGNNGTVPTVTGTEA